MSGRFLYVAPLALLFLCLLWMLCPLSAKILWIKGDRRSLHYEGAINFSNDAFDFAERSKHSVLPAYDIWITRMVPAVLLAIVSAFVLVIRHYRKGQKLSVSLSAMLLTLLLWTLCPASGRILWKAEGDGRYLPMAGIFNYWSAGFSYHEGYTNGEAFPQWDMLITWLFPAFLLAAAMGVALLMSDFRQAHSTVHGATSCSHCGYDLRATPKRCPECGSPRV